MNYSYWEHKSYFEDLDLIIAGGGFTAYSTAIQFLKARPNSKVLVLEPDPFGSLASSKNAGFLCFGSTSELLRYIEDYGADQLSSLLRRQKAGRDRMLQWLGASSLQYKYSGGSELFLQSEDASYSKSIDNLKLLNIIFKDVGVSDEQFKTSASNHHFSANHYLGEIAIENEAQIDSSRTLLAYRKYAMNLGDVRLLPFFLEDFSRANDEVKVKLTNGTELCTKKLVLATNALTSALSSESKKSIEPARGLVLVTSPIKGLRMNRNYHHNSGYIYFRNHNSRVIIGGARDIDINSENTSEVAYNHAIRNQLTKTLKDVVLPESQFEIDHEWVGFMGFTSSGKPIDNQIDNSIYFAAGLNGMGVALSNQLGYETANRVAKDW